MRHNKLSNIVYITFSIKYNITLIYNAAGNISCKINKLFHINSAGAGVVKYNNKISAHTQRLINYFELMYAKTM